VKFRDKTILITGASSGIGTAFAHRFAREGGHLILSARRRDRLEQIADTLRRDYGILVHVFVADLSLADAPAQLHAEIASANLHVDVLINNAGFGHQGHFLDADRQFLVDMVQVNVTALTALTHLFVPGMLERGFGGVVNVASMAGFTAIPYFSAYAATKAYVISFSSGIWKEYRNRGVHVVALCPGPVDTGFFEVSGYNPKGMVGRQMQTSEEVVETALRALIRNIPVVPTSFSLKIMAVLQKFVPRKLALTLMAGQMKPPSEV
jgi:short-subunit dehydrogenase